MAGALSDLASGIASNLDGKDATDTTATDSTWWVYMLRCADGSLYTGVTRDLARRIRQHNGELVGGANYTRARRPVAAVWKEAWESRSAAQVREAELKRLSRRKKLSLLGSSSPETPDS